MVNYFVVIIIIFIVCLALCLAAICCYLIRNSASEMHHRRSRSSSSQGSDVLGQVEVVIGTVKLHSGDGDSTSTNSTLSSASRFTSPPPDLRSDTQNTATTVRFNEDVEVCYVFEKSGSTDSKDRTSVTKDNASGGPSTSKTSSTDESAPL